ncbi:MAG: alpha/beta hydrolase [Methanophagales archaeon]|nr:alpha/beta hydrolase [Methanophagales archaeon]
MKRLFAAVVVIAAIVSAIFLSGCATGPDWRVTDDGMLEYPDAECTPEYQLAMLETADNYSLYEVTFTSRGTEISGLMRMPGTSHEKDVPGVVMLPGATVTKEGEQGLAKYLCSLGYASIALDQRNLGIVDMRGDLQTFLNGEEPTEHKMVHDALAAAAVLRNQPVIDQERIVFAGESNGARFAIIACALDPKARGVIAISTCGYGVDSAIASGQLNDPDVIRFYRSIDPDTYLGKIPPRKFVMIHSLNDTVIPYESAQQTYAKAGESKELHTVECATHGYCEGMDAALKTELEKML